MDSKKCRGDALKAYKDRIGEWAPVSLALLLVAACCAGLSLLGSLWVLLGIGLLFLPTLFAATQFLAASLTDKPADTSIITRAFGAYFRTPGLGVYRFFLNGILAFVSTIGAGFAFVSIYYLVFSLVDPNFGAIVDSITSALYAGDYDAALAAFDSAGVFSAMYDISAIVLAFALVFFCWLFFGRYAQNGILRNAFRLDNPRLANFFYRHYRVIVKADWVKTRLPFLLFPLVCMALGATTSTLCYYFGVKVNLSVFFGLLAFAFLFSLYLPLGLYLHSLFAFSHESSVSKAFYRGSQEIYKQYAANGRASEEELAAMREELDRLKPKESEDDKK